MRQFNGLKSEETQGGGGKPARQFMGSQVEAKIDGTDSNNENMRLGLRKYHLYILNSEAFNFILLSKKSCILIFIQVAPEPNQTLHTLLHKFCSYVDLHNDLCALPDTPRNKIAQVPIPSSPRVFLEVSTCNVCLNIISPSISHITLNR